MGHHVLSTTGLIVKIASIYRKGVALTPSDVFIVGGGFEYDHTDDQECVLYRKTAGDVLLWLSDFSCITNMHSENAGLYVKLFDEY